LDKAALLRNLNQMGGHTVQFGINLPECPDMAPVSCHEYLCP